MGHAQVNSTTPSFIRRSTQKARKPPFSRLTFRSARQSPCAPSPSAPRNADDHVAVALAGSRMALRRSRTAASMCRGVFPSRGSTGHERRVLGRRRADGGVVGGGDGDADHAGLAATQRSISSLPITGPCGPACRSRRILRPALAAIVAILSHLLRLRFDQNGSGKMKFGLP